MKKPILFVILDSFADHECPFLANPLQDGVHGEPSRFEVKTVSLTKDPVRSIGGFTVVPDYDLSDYPNDYEGVILIGGTSWRGKAADQVLPLIEQALAWNKVVGAICDATTFLARHGILDSCNHTGNALQDLQIVAKDRYQGSDRYKNEQAVRDGLIVTANGSAYLEFAREVLHGLEAYPPQTIEMNYRFFKEGMVSLFGPGSDFNAA